MPSETKTLVVKCPTCARPVPWQADQVFKPFCSERCRLIDLGEWVMEEKRIPGQPLPDDDNAGAEDFFQ